MKFLSFLKRLFRRKSDPKHPLMQHSGSASVSASINSHTFDPTTHDLVYDVTSNRISRQTKEETRAANNLILYTLDKTQNLDQYTIRLPDESIEGRYLATLDLSRLGLRRQRFEGTVYQICVRVPLPSQASNPTTQNSRNLTAPSTSAATTTATAALVTFANSTTASPSGQHSTPIPPPAFHSPTTSAQPSRALPVQFSSPIPPPSSLPSPPSHSPPPIPVTHGPP